MKLKGSIILTVALLLSILPVQAATIFGTVYDFELQQVNNVRVSINTTPEQQLIATSGRYSINVPLGDYLITAEQLETGNVIASTEEVVTITKEGSYVIDLIVFPSLQEDILNDSDIVIDDMSETQSWSTAIIGFAIGLIVILIAIMYRITSILNRVKKGMSQPKSKDESLPKDLQEIVDMIKSSDKRTTQKELRQKLPQLSEAKISLMITDLEKRGLVEKIKKGRGNIIILKS